MFVATVDVKVVAALHRGNVGIVVAVQKADSNVLGVVGTKGCRLHVLTESTACKIAHDLVLGIHVGIDGVSETAVGCAAVGETDQVDTSLDSFRGSGDAFLKGLEAIGCKVPLLKPGEPKVGECIGRLSSSTNSQRVVIFVVVGKEASRGECTVSGVFQWREADCKVHLHWIVVFGTHENVVVSVERPNKDGALLRRDASKVATAAVGAVAMQGTDKVDRRHDGLSGRENDTHGMKPNPTAGGEKRTALIEDGQKDLDRPIGVHGDDVVGFFAIDVACVDLDKLARANRNPSLPLKPNSAIARVESIANDNVEVVVVVKVADRCDARGVDRGSDPHRRREGVCHGDGGGVHNLSPHAAHAGCPTPSDAAAALVGGIVAVFDAVYTFGTP